MSLLGGHLWKCSLDSSFHPASQQVPRICFVPSPVLGLGNTEENKTRVLPPKALTVNRGDRQVNRPHNTASGSRDEEQTREKVVRKSRRQAEAGRELQETAGPEAEA